MPSSSSRSPARSIAPPAAALPRWRKKGVVKGPQSRPRPPIHLPASLPRAGRSPGPPAPSPRGGSGRRSPSRPALLPVPPRARRSGAPRPGAWRGAHLAVKRRPRSPTPTPLCRVRPASTSRARVAGESEAGRKCRPACREDEPRRAHGAGPRGRAEPRGPSSQKWGQFLGDHATEGEPARRTFPCSCANVNKAGSTELPHLFRRDELSIMHTKGGCESTQKLPVGAVRPGERDVLAFHCIPSSIV